MAEPNSVSTLRKKRDEIRDYIRETEKRLAQARQDLMHVNATMRLFEVNGDTTQFPVYVNLARMFPRGDVPKLARECLAASPDGTADTRQIGDYIMRQRGWDMADKALVVTVRGYVVRSMYEHGRRKRQFECIGKRNGVNLWRAANLPPATNARPP